MKSYIEQLLQNFLGTVSVVKLGIGRIMLFFLVALIAACSDDVTSSNDPSDDSLNDLPDGLVYSSEYVGERPDGSGAFRTHCLETHENFDDPLVYPGEPGATHHHIFFGNPTIDAFTTTESLLEATETTCDGNVLNRTAYWVPALYDRNEERIEYVDPLFYYKTGYHVPAESIQTLPEGLRIIAGNAHATNPQSSTVVKFRCSSWESDQESFDPGDPLDQNNVNYLPDCEFDDLLEMRIVFPQCWDGENLDSPAQSHMAYPNEATPPNTGTGACPESHPIAIPEISYNFAIYVTENRGKPSSWRFSSDLMHGVDGGVTFHADWMNGWDPEIMEKIVTNCLQPARECLVGLLGDGTRLEPVVED